MGIWMFASGKAEAHPHKIFECRNNIIYEKAALLREDVHPYLPLWVEFYDTNDDAVPDVIAQSAIINISGPQDNPQYSHHPIPGSYIVDRDYDGYGDEVYIDRRGDARRNSKFYCDIYLYKKLDGPNPPNMEERDSL